MWLAGYPAPSNIQAGQRRFYSSMLWAMIAGAQVLWPMLRYPPGTSNLVPDHALHEGRAAATLLLRPGDAGPAGVVLLLLPLLDRGQPLLFRESGVAGPVPGGAGDRRWLRARRAPRRGNSLPVVSPESPWLIPVTPRLDRTPTKECSDDRLKTKTSRREAVRVRDRRPQRPRGDRYFSAEAPSITRNPRSPGSPAAPPCGTRLIHKKYIYIYIY